MTKRIDQDAHIKAIRLHNRGNVVLINQGTLSVQNARQSQNIEMPSSYADEYSWVFAKNDGVYLGTSEGTINGPLLGKEGNKALGIVPTYSPSPHASYSDFGANSYMTEADSDYGTATSASKLTDGYRTLAVEVYSSGRYIAWQQQDSTIQFNLGNTQNIRQVRVYGLLDSGVTIYRPSSIEVKRSSDGAAWTSVISKTSLTAGTGTRNWIIVLNFSPANYQYWQVILGKPTVGGSYHFVGEVELRVDAPI